MKEKNQFHLDRFKKAQEEFYSQALQEMKEGRKRTHWIWFIFPQIKGIGYSEMSQYYSIESLDEAKAYLKDTQLKNHLDEITSVLLSSKESCIQNILEDPDDKKLSSSMTLFYFASKDELYKKVIDKYFSGKMDTKTIEILQNKKEDKYDRKTNCTH